MGETPSGIAKRQLWLAAFALLLLLVGAVPVMAAEEPDQRQITEGIEAVEREEARREEELETPAATREREVTRGAFTEANAGEAKQLLISAFPEQLGLLNADPARFLSDAKIIHTAGEEGAVVSQEGDTSLMEAGIPVRTEDEEGEVSKVDLSLVPADTGFEAKNPLVDVQIPSSAAAPVEVGEEGLGISLAGAAGAAQPLGEENVFYHDVQPDSDLLVSPVAHGVELFDQLRSPQSPEALRFQLTLPQGAALRADGSGGAEVVRGDEALASIPPPSAVDAQGSELPVELQVEGNAVVLQVPHRQQEFAYPILVDPIVEDWLNAGVSWVNGHSYKALENGAWQWTSEPYGQMSIGTSCFYHCWGSGRGLYVSAPSRNYGSEVHAHWSYVAPNLGSFVSQVWLNPLYRDDHGCSSTQYAQPHDYEGLWTGNGWEPLKTNEALKGLFTVQAGEGWGRSVIVGLSSANGVNLPCWRDLAVGGAAVWLDDWEPPSQPNVTGMPTGWLKKGNSYTLNVEASSPGLGVQKVRLLSPGEKEWLWNQPWCSGLYENRCPASASGQLTFSTEAFMEGGVSVSVNAMSASGKIGPPRTYELQVDGTAPAVKLSGQFAKATEPKGVDELTLPVYNLTVKAEDLLGAGPNFGSGVKEIKLFLDGKALESKGATCLATSCPNTFESTFAVPLAGLGEGEHSLETRAKDFVGNETQTGESKIGFKYIPATGMKEEYVLQHFLLPDGHDYSGDSEYRGPELSVNVVNGNVVYRERDLDVDAPSGDLEVERIYNSQQPTSRDGQWGHGWTLAQAPEFKPEAGESTPETATMVKTSAVTTPVELPQSPTQTTFDPELHATVAEVAGGGYEVTSTTDEETSVFDSSGRIEETRLSSVSPEVTVQPEPVFPAFVESLGSPGSGNGQLSHPADVAADAKGNLWIVDSGNNRIEQFNEAGEFVRAAGSAGSGANQLNSPSAVAVDSAGNVDVTDTGNNRVVRFNEKGEFISAVGWNVNRTKVESGGTQAEKNLCTAASGNACQAGTSGALDGQMAQPVGIATAGGQEFFVVEKGNGRVEKFGPQGELLAKIGAPGSGGGQLAEPTGIAYSAYTGFLWVADTGNDRIQKWTTAGAWAGKVGWEGSAGGLFQGPTAIEADAEGNLYVADPGNQRVQMLSRAGDYVTQFETEGALSLTAPAGIFTTAAGELWLTDSEGGRLQKWLTGSSVLWSSRIGSLGSGNGQFFHPADVAVDGKGNVLALDQGNSRVEKFNSKNEFLTTFGAESQPWKLSQPSALAVDQSNSVWVADTSKHRVVKFNEAGQFVLTFGRNVNKTKVDAGGSEAEKNVCTAASGNVCQAGLAGTASGQLSSPKGIAIASDGSVWVADTGNNRLKKFSSTGTLLAIVGSEGSGSGQLKEPMAIAVAPDKSIWVADSGNNRIEQWSPTLGFLRQMGSQGTGNGQFKQPSAIDVDASGNIWVGDQLNDRVQELTSTGQYVAQYGDSSRFDFGRPMGLAADGQGNVWVTDSEHNRLQKLPTTQFAEPAVTQVPAVAYSYGSGLLTKMELEEPEAPDPAITVVSSSGLTSSVSSGSDSATYSYTSGNLSSVKHPEGETKFERDGTNKIKKIELPNGTWVNIGYDTLGRATHVTVKPAGGTEKTTNFWYGTNPRETRVSGGGEPETTYSIAEDGSVLTWWYDKVPPTLEGFTGSLWSNRNSPTPIENKNHYFAVTAKSQNEISSVQLLVNGTSVVAEETCEDNAQPPDHHCDAVPLEWVTHAAAHPPGQLNLEVVATNFLGEKTAERFFVTVPQQPPVDPEAPEAPTYESIKQFREDYGLDRNKSTSKSEQTRFILELLYEWESQQPTAVTAVANWGVPMRAPELAEMENRKQIAQQASEVIPQWAEEHAPSSYGGFYVDDKAGGKIYVGFTENQAALTSALKQEAGLLSPATVFEFPTPPTKTIPNLEVFAESVTAALRGSSAGGAAVSVAVSPGGNSVEVGAIDPSSIQAFLVGQFGASAPISVHEEERESLMLGRFPSSGPVIAGAALSIGRSFCTAGFGSRAQTGESRGTPVYTYFSLTAGHCWPHGLTVYRQKERLGETRENSPIGEVKRGPYSVSEFRVTDAEAIRIDSGIRSYSVLNPPPNSGALEAQSIQGVEPPRVGRYVCWSGVMSGPHCGKVTTRYEAVQEDGHERVLYKVDGPSISGDSGGPVWDPITHKAVGLITTGVRSPQKKCHVVYVELHSCPRMGFTPLTPGKLRGEMPGVAAFLGVQILKEE